jgi:hypothetical protein
MKLDFNPYNNDDFTTVRRLKFRTRAGRTLLNAGQNYLIRSVQ